MALEKIKFQTNVPVECRLAFLEGKECDSQYGSGKQFMFTTNAGAFFVSEAVGNILHDQIKRLKVQVGEEVSICKAEADTGSGRKGIQWRISTKVKPGEQPDGTYAVPKDQPGAGASTPTPGATAASQPPTSNGNGSTNGNGHNGNGHAASDPAMAHWAQVLVSQANTLVDCYAACLLYANKHGNQVKPDDVRALLTTVFIGLSKKGGSHGA